MSFPEIPQLARMTLAQVQAWHSSGCVTQDQFEAYMHCWALLSPHGGSTYWHQTPPFPAVRRIAREILRERGEAIPEALGEEEES